MKPSSSLNRSHSKRKPHASKSTGPSTSSSQKEKFPRFPSLEELPPPEAPVEQSQRRIGAPMSTTSFEPLSESEISSLLPLIGNTIDYITTSTTLSDVSVEESIDMTVTSDKASTFVDQVLVEQNSCETGNENLIAANESNDVLKKIALISQPPSPAILTDMSATKRPPSPHPDTLGHDDGASIESPRCNPPASPSSLPFPLTCWSDGADKDLVAHIGPSERNRQELMWEIVASEERYVAELLKMRETFINPLLHPYTSSSSPITLEHDDMSQLETTVESLERLPIASRFLSSPADGTDDLDDSEEGRDKAGMTFLVPRQGGRDDLFFVPEHDPRSPLSSRKPRDSFVSLSRSHQSLRLPSRRKRNAVSTASLDRRFFLGHSPTETGRDRGGKSTSTDPTGQRVQQKSKEISTKVDLISNGGVAPHQIPDDLRHCLEIIGDTIIPGHIMLSKCLRKRYDEQYPLVRSLADVFVANSHILRGYAEYVLHLKRALEQANDAISTSNLSKRPKNKDQDEWIKLSTFLRKLEMDAQDRGETGLAISLSKPFQRLLNYSMLFRALLFHTDPWMLEYEGTLQLVTEVEDIVHDIEDAKEEKEKRDKTRDIFARIKGLDKVKQLAVPKPSRVLVEEKMLDPREDVLRSGGGGIGSRKDVWLVVFNDVVLRCQRTGITSLPLGAAQVSRANSLFELHGSSKSSTTGRRNPSTQPRNLYKFIKIENWAIAGASQPGEGVVSMEDVVRSRAQIYSSAQPRCSVHSSGRKQKQNRTFSHWSSDNVILQKSLAGSQIGPAGYGSRQTESSPSLYSGSSLANAKSGSRLTSANSLFSASPTASRLTVTTPSPCSAKSDEGYLVRAFTRLGLGEHGWGQIDPAAPFLYPGETFANAKFGSRLVPLNPLPSRGH